MLTPLILQMEAILFLLNHIVHLQLVICLSSNVCALGMAVSEGANNQQEQGHQGSCSVSSSFPCPLWLVGAL